MLAKLKAAVHEANLRLVSGGLVTLTWGNASGLTADRKFMVIKPSGVGYAEMRPDDMIVVSTESGEVVEGSLKPSSDTETHLELYRSFLSVGGIVHAHSTNAVAFAQAGKDIPAIGTTHADHFYGDVPCTRALTSEEVRSAYELNTGRVIVETLDELGVAPEAMPGILVRNHGPFTWGADARSAVDNAIALETVAEMCLKTLALDPQSTMDSCILDKHHSRKHGPNAYYGQG